MKMIRSTHTLITIIIAAILSVIFLVSYFILITPNDKQALKYDQERERDFSSIVKVIKAYREEKNNLPESLDSLKEEAERKMAEYGSGGDGFDSLSSFIALQSFPLRDPYSNRPYTYKYENRDSEKFQLCTKFFKENKGEEDDVKKGSSSEVKHGSGEQCVDFEAKKKKTHDSYKYSVPQTDDELDEMTDEEYQQYLEDKYKYDSYDNGSDSQN
jgi:hypothetical protein